MKIMMDKYNLTKCPSDESWYEVSINRVKQLFEDIRFNGEIVHLYNDYEDGAESLIQTEDELKVAIFEATENGTPFVIYTTDVEGHPELFELS